MHIERFWINGDMRGTYYPPYGTIECDAVKLIKEVSH
jgi:hypothetical protein